MEAGTGNARKFAPAAPRRPIMEGVDADGQRKCVRDAVSGLKGRGGEEQTTHEVLAQ